MVRDLVNAGLFGDPNDPKLRTALTQGVEAAAQASQVSAAIQDMILSLTDPVGAALKQLEAEHAARLEAVKAVGGDIVAAERLTQLQRQQIVEQGLARLQQAEAQLEGGKSQLRQFFTGLTEPLSRGLGELSLGDLSALSPGEQLGIARNQFEFGIKTVDTIRDTSRQQIEAVRELQAEVRRLRQLMEGRAA
jgi:hypothetical protein